MRKMTLIDKIITELAEECGYRCRMNAIIANRYVWVNAGIRLHIIVIDGTILKFTMNNQIADLNDPNVLESIKTIINKTIINNYYYESNRSNNHRIS